MMKNVIFIPIKHESQRVPGKNFRVLGEYSLWKRCIKKFRDFDIFIDTDSDEILKEIHDNRSEYYYVTAYPREKHLVGHTISVNDLINNFVTKYCSLDDKVCQIHVTNPFLERQLIKTAFDILKKAEYDSVVSCNQIKSRLWRKESYGYCPINHNPMKLEQTQDLPELYEENSCFYAFKAVSFLSNKNRVGNSPIFWPVNFPNNLDLDTEDDWKMCQLIYNSSFKGNEIL